jgi:hypothetical protein
MARLWDLLFFTEILNSTALGVGIAVLILSKTFLPKTKNNVR